MSDITKKAILESFKKILCEKTFSKITIKDITDDCGINRMTFYYHFKDIYDLVEWALSQKLDQALQGDYSFATWKQRYLNVFLATLDMKDLILKVYPSMDMKNIERYLIRVAHQLMHAVIEEKAGDYSVSDYEKNFISEMYENMLVGTFLRWIERGMKEDPAYIVECFSVAVQGGIARSFAHFSSKKR